MVIFRFHLTSFKQIWGFSPLLWAARKIKHTRKDFCISLKVRAFLSHEQNFSHYQMMLLECHFFKIGTQVIWILLCKAALMMHFANRKYYRVWWWWWKWVYATLYIIFAMLQKDVLWIPLAFSSALAVESVFECLAFLTFSTSHQLSS